MIFVTVGTHEQQFNRLVEYMDLWAKDHKEKVVIQTGYSTYEPKYCEWSKLFPYDEMVNMVNKARIVITHGGPSSFIMPLQIGKIPIVVPRQKKFDEHVNNHQVDFCNKVKKRHGNIIVVNNINILDNDIVYYDNAVNGLSNGLISNNKLFCRSINQIVDKLVKG